MNLKNMDYYLVVCDSKTITSASNALQVSQQALSQTIKKIEEEFGEKLFYRTNPIELTEAGKRVQQTFKRIIQEYSELAVEFKKKTTDSIVIGYYEEKKNIQEFIDHLIKQNPEIKISAEKILGNYISDNIDIILSKTNLETHFQYVLRLPNSIMVWIKDGIENNKSVKKIIDTLYKK